jgi:putative glutamine amidotransferase
MRPLIGMSVYRTYAAWGVWHASAALLPHSYADHVAAAGGIPVLLPISGDDAAGDAIARLDALILTGGPDIEPLRYSALPDPFAERSQAERDAWETALLTAALRVDLPVLGICRGLQLINVHYGGSLVQHLPEQSGGSRHRPAPGVFGTVRVRLDTAALPGSLLGSEVDVPCHHHQAVERLGTGLAATGWAVDGTIEAAWIPSRRFVVGVQWHPEELDDAALFAALVKAAR